jgi:ribulose-phosphate 3-epimerase
MVVVAVSLLDADWGKIDSQLDMIKDADRLHFDICDGKFVKRKTGGPELLGTIHSDKFKEVHLMVEEPEKHIHGFLEAGADLIAFHVEATERVDEIIDILHDNKKKACIVINPDTDLARVVPYLHKVDQLLVMTVHPGMSGQECIPSMFDRIQTLNKDYSELPIEVDGCMNEETSKLAVESGADIIVSGTFVWESGNPAEKIDFLKKL